MMTDLMRQNAEQTSARRFLDWNCEGQFLGNCWFRFPYVDTYIRCELTEAAFHQLSAMVIAVLNDMAKTCRDKHISQEALYGFYQMVPQNTGLDYLGAQCAAMFYDEGGRFYTDSVTKLFAAVHDKWKLSGPKGWARGLYTLSTSLFWVALTAYAKLDDPDSLYGAYEFVMKTILSILGTEITEEEFHTAPKATA